MAKTKLEEFFQSLDTENQQSVSEVSTEGSPQEQPQPVQEQQLVQEQQEEQPIQEQQLIAGKFKSVDDLINSYQELERKFYDIQERLKRAEQGLEAFKMQQPSVQQMPVVPQQQDIDIDVDPLVDPKGFAKKITEKVSQTVLQQVQQQMLLQRQIDEIRERFYRLNPDLVGKEKLVGLIAQDVAREMPTARLDDVLEEVAKRTRQFLKSLTSQQKSVQQPVSPTPQTMPVREKPVQQQLPELTEEQELEEYLKQRKQFLQKRKL